LNYFKNINKNFDFLYSKFYNVDKKNKKLKNFNILIDKNNINWKQKLLNTSNYYLGLKNKNIFEFYNGRVNLLKKKNTAYNNIYVDVGVSRLDNLRNVIYKKNNF
jgi:hypothetical protein